MANKRRKLVVQQDASLLNKDADCLSQTLTGLRIYVRAKLEAPESYADIVFRSMGRPSHLSMFCQR